MEKDMFFRTEDNTFVPFWNSSSFGVEIQPNELNCHSEQLPSFFFNPNWDNSMVQSNPFESSLSSMVSSPAASIAAVPGGGGGQFGLIEYELMPGGLTPRMESGKISRASSNLSIKICGSPMGLLGNRNGFSHDGKSDSDNKFSRNSTSSTPENAEFGDFGGESAVSEQIPCGEIAMKGQNDANAKKRKSIPRGKAKETPLFSPASYARVATWSDDELIAKRSKVGEALGNEKDGEKSKAEASEKGKLGSENGNKKQSKNGEKSPEPPKDYIHLRARRGQATDSHSLAERVRREKIGERMKFLQDLVPGCNKVMGKAVMLDEIINYVQSLQQQVEFLSLKLANVNPRMGLNIEALLSKEIFQSCESAPPNIYPFVYQSPHGPFLHSCILNPNETENSSLAIQNLSMQLLPAGGFGEASSLAQWLTGDVKVEL